MAQSSDYYLQLNDDGTPRRKHDIEERDVRRPVFFSVAGFVFFNAFAVLKAMWFGDEGARAESHGRAGSGGFDFGHSVASGGSEDLLVASSGADSAEAAGQDESASAPESGYVRASGLKFSLSQLDLNFSDTGAIVTARLGAPLAAPSNDNVRLYGAQPGQAIKLSESYSGGGGSAGEGNAQTEGDREADEDDGAVEGNGGGGGSSGNGGVSNDPRGNRLPVVSNVVILSALVINEVRSLDLFDLLRSSYDADGDSLLVSNIKASAGHVIVTSTGGFLYIPEFNDRSVVEFTYDIQDGHGVVQQTAFMPIVAGPFVPLTGTDGDDDLASDPMDEMLGHIVEAGTGNDIIRTGSGDDIVYGSSGDDVISTGAGNDVIFAGDGDDVVDAGSGDDQLYGEGGNDDLRGGAGSDRLDGGAGHDLLSGDDGNDFLIGGAGEDQIDGGAGDDVIYGESGDGDDVMTGGAGDDTYFAAAHDGADIFHGGEGDDVFIAAEIGSGDTFYGDEGSDTYNASAVEDDLLIDLTAGTVRLLDGVDVVPPFQDIAGLPGDESIDDVIGLTAAAEPPDRLVDVENVVGGLGNDTIVANEGVNSLSGGAGEDTFVFQTVASAGSGKGSRDKILDFEVGDRIDIDDISDEFESEFNDVFDDPGIRKFVLIAHGQEFARPGEVRFKYDEAEHLTVLEGNIDYDADIDFEIEILGQHQLRYDKCLLAVRSGWLSGRIMA